jgi:WD40 repeat protein
VTLEGHTWNLKCASWSSDSRFIITGSEDKTARVWKARTGECISVLVGHTDKVFSVTLAPTTQFGVFQAITGGFEGDVRCWDIMSGACERIIALSGPASAFSFGKRGEQELRYVKTHLLHHCRLRMIILPRQARDKT